MSTAIKTGALKLTTIISEINDIVNISFEGFQGWTTLKNWAVGETRLFEETGIVSKKILHTDIHCRFICTIPPDISFGGHWHDCNEVCTVLAGTLSDRVTNLTYKLGGQCVYPKGAKHEPFNPSEVYDCVLIVDFYRN